MKNIKNGNKFLIIILMIIMFIFNVYDLSFATIDGVNYNDADSVLKYMNNYMKDKKTDKFPGTLDDLVKFSNTIESTKEYKGVKELIQTYKIKSYEDATMNSGQTERALNWSKLKNKEEIKKGYEYYECNNKINSIKSTVETDTNNTQKTNDASKSIENEEERKKLEKYTPKEIYNYYQANGKRKLIEKFEQTSAGRSVLKAWRKNIKNDSLANAAYKKVRDDPNHSGTPEGMVYYIIIGDETEDTDIYVQPKKNPSGDSSEESLEDMVSDADKFVGSVGSDDLKYKQSALETFSKTFYNIMLTVGIFVAVIIGGILGLKLMTSGVEEKADVKKLLIPYVVGCIVVFGGFGIWKLVVTLLQGI